MRKATPALFGAAILLGSIGCSSPPPGGNELTADDRAALQHIADNDAAIVLARDWDALTARFSEDAVRMPPNGPEINGRAAIREFLEGMPPVGDFTFKMTSLDGNARLAYMRAKWSYRLEPPNAPAVVDSGKILIVYEKQEDGRWLSVADAWNSDLPAAG
jgi:ketosteroid isomerase-like protein